MNAQEAVNKIAELLGMKFKSEKFMITKLVDNQTTITNNTESPFTIGDAIFVVEDSILKPAPEGVHKTREGLVLSVGPDSVIYKIEEEQPQEESSEIVDEAETNIETSPEVMSEATLADGTKVEPDSEGDFEVGQKLYVVKDGERMSAPEGEHTTESGIVITVDSEGTITGVKYPDEEGEGSLENDMKKMKEAMSQVLILVNQFSKTMEKHKTELEEFKNSPAFDRPAVVSKTFGKENMLDAKVAFLRQALRKS